MVVSRAPPSRRRFAWPAWPSLSMPMITWKGWLRCDRSGRERLREPAEATSEVAHSRVSNWARRRTQKNAGRPDLDVTATATTPNLYHPRSGFFQETALRRPLLFGLS